MASRQKTGTTSIPAQRIVSKVHAEIIEVTPAQADEWLKRNTSNRRLREVTVKLYMQDMQSGAWKLNGEAIKVADDGTLLDGQHRLEAVRRSGKTVPMMVITGLPRDTQETMDIGRKRNAQDAFTLRGEVNATALSAITRRVVLWDRGDRSFREVVSFAEMSAKLEEYPSLRRSAEIAVRTNQSFRFLPISAVGTAHHLTSRVAPDEVPWFFASLASGADLETGDPVLVLRTRAMTDRASGTKVSDVRALAYIVRAWNVYRRREKIAKIQHAMDAPIPDVQ